MNGRRLIWIFGALLVIALTAGQMQSTAQAGQQKLGESQGITDWKTFTDDKCGLSLSYPKDWQSEHYSFHDGRDSQFAYIDRYVFGKDDEGFEIHVFLLSDKQTLLEWYQQHKRAEPQVEVPEKENSVIAGIPAYVLVLPPTRNTPTMFTAFWAYKGKVFQLEGTLPVEVLVKVLESLRYGDSAPKAAVPESIIIAGSKLQVYNSSNRCCEVDDPGNPYSCCFCCCCQSAGCDCNAGWPSCDSTGNGDCNGSCANPPYNRGPQRGNCVWWASYLRQDTGGTPMDRWGNPSTWVTRSLDSNLLVSYRPTSGAIAVSKGHVAFVESVLSASRFLASEMNACWCNSGTGACGNSTCQQEVEKNVGGFRYIYPPLELASNLVAPQYVDRSTSLVRVEASVWNRSRVEVGGTGRSLLWRLKVTNPQGTTLYWQAPASFLGFAGGQTKTLRLDFTVPDYSGILCQANGPYRIEGLEYGEYRWGINFEPPVWIPLMNSANYQISACLNGCCASGSSSIQGAELQSCPNYCGGQVPTPTSTPGPGYTPTPTSQPPSDGRGITLYEFDNCQGQHDQFLYNGCWNLINARNADSFSVSFASPKHIHFYQGPGCDPTVRQDEWKGTTTNGCQPLPGNIKGWVGSIHIADYVPGTPTPTRRMPPTATLAPPSTKTSTPAATATKTSTPQQPTRTPTRTTTPTIGPLQKGLGGYVRDVETDEGIAEVHLSLHYYSESEGRWVGSGDTWTNDGGQYLLRTTVAAKHFLVAITELPEGFDFYDVDLHDNYATKVDERTIEWTFPNPWVVGFYESDFLVVGQPPTPTVTRTRTPTATATPSGARPKYWIDWLSWQTPTTLNPNQWTTILVTIRNGGNFTWRKETHPDQVWLGYWYRDPTGIWHQGWCTALPEDISPGETFSTQINFQAPESPGVHLVTLDAVHIGVAWFSTQGSPNLPFNLTVTSGPGATATWTATPSKTPTRTPTATTGPHPQIGIRMEGEWGPEGGDLVEKEDDEASACRFITSRDKKDAQGETSFVINIPESGWYILRGRVRGDAHNHNSFFIQVDGGDKVPWDFPLATNWSWTEVEDKRQEGDDPYLWNLNRGSHLLTIYPREETACLDALEFVKAGSSGYDWWTPCQP